MAAPLMLGLNPVMIWYKQYKELVQDLVKSSVEMLVLNQMMIQWNIHKEFVQDVVRRSVEMIHQMMRRYKVQIVLP